MSFDPCNVSRLLPRLEREGFSFEKGLGQNFVIDPSVPETLAEGSGCDRTWGVVEIGPGAGALTLRLAQRAGKVAAIELDSRILPVLADTLKDYDNVTVLRGDAMRLNLKDTLEPIFGDMPLMCCANLPYNITTEAIDKLVFSGLFKRVTVMIQREAAQKLLCKAGDKDWCLFSARVQSRCTVKKLRDVSPDCFIPAPHVTSSIIRIDITQPENAQKEEHFLRVLDGAFRLRRKTLTNSMSSCLPFSAEQIAGALEKMGLDKRIRGEAMTLPQLRELAGILYGE